MSFVFTALVAALVIIGLFVLYSADNYLRTELANAAEVQGRFTLLLYGCPSPDELANIAVLDREEDPYSFEIPAPGFASRTRTGLTAAEALQEAEKFVRCNIRSERTAVRRILGPDSRVIGFEVRPLYSVAAFGKDDILDVRYLIRDKQITVQVQLDPAVELQRTG